MTGRSCHDPDCLAEDIAVGDELGRVLRMFGKEERGVVLVDEVDLVLHPLKSELNFPIGDMQALDFTPERWELALHAIAALFGSTPGETFPRGLDPLLSLGKDEAAILEDIQAAIRSAAEDGRCQVGRPLPSPLSRQLCSQCTPQTHPTLVLVDRSVYAERMLPLLAKWMAVWVRAQLDTVACTLQPLTLVTPDEVRDHPTASMELQRASASSQLVLRGAGDSYSPVQALTSVRSSCWCSGEYPGTPTSLLLGLRKGIPVGSSLV